MGSSKNNSRNVMTKAIKITNGILLFIYES